MRDIAYTGRTLGVDLGNELEKKAAKEPQERKRNGRIANR